MSDTRILVVLGTRPEIIKLAPVVDGCLERGVDVRVVHTGQHYSPSLDTVFFDQLDLPPPTHQLGVGSTSHGEQTAAILRSVERIVVEGSPDHVLVQGDTNSALAGALAAAKLDASLGHVEAGLRSFDDRMPEETNRVLIDHVSDLLFAPTPIARSMLRREGIDDDRIVVTGNTVVDALVRYGERAARRSQVLSELSLSPGEYVLLTVHRAENVDSRERFERILTGVSRFARAVDRPVVYPVHPRARERLDRFEISLPEPIEATEPREFFDFLTLEREAAVVFTDSGGVQEETCVLGVPCVTVRETTERPETVDVGSNRVIGIDPEDVERAGHEMLGRSGEWENPFGDGDAATRILEAIGVGP
ncbi:non-hydrolyzing UDP-N-acetylglucosamine 2-epimerase [Natronorarus salvus]|uniref:non-hydrolyzing UDP-N-acetylglucosamine 2-epimerase n=1 Tax=Natronorarus salvus TaxID=3117733 RepID=UPI002F264CF0